MELAHFMPEVFVAAMCGKHFSEQQQFIVVMYQVNLFKTTDIGGSNFNQLIPLG